VASIRFHPRTGIFLPLPPLLSSLLLFLPSHPPSVLLDTHPSPLFFSCIYLFATFTMSSQADKSFMGMPVSVTLLTSPAPCLSWHRLRAATNFIWMPSKSASIHPSG
jgi:hypothetical protein